ncbi:MAG: GTP cyclohydrolase I FolE2 [Desulfovibrionaceae bacterium]|jgi:GTP cyclohydrolase I|nr:GTP cyclohydrolase I FolE2 [Desulfovibrionaceae bacterium]
MRDVQSGPAQVALPIDRVGVKNLRLPLLVRDRVNGNQHTVADVDIGADLPAHFKGTHMSRFVEALDSWSEDLDYKSVQRLLNDVRARLEAERAFVTFRFPFFLAKQAPATGSPAIMSYDCRLTGEIGPEDNGRPRFLLQVDVPVMTVCPCSKAISDEGAHSQRALVRIQARFAGFTWLEELVDIADAAGSSPVYTLLKREDEKFVTESAFANPTFVEDVVRSVAQALAAHPQTTWFRVEVESFESIHNHSAFAVIEQRIERA